jgi:parvulin-like peptidyl-prolyl isomerase
VRLSAHYRLAENGDWLHAGSGVSSQLKSCVMVPVPFFSILCVLFAPALAHAQPKLPVSGDPVAATVNDEKVYRSEVLRTFFTTLKGKHKSLDGLTRNKLLATVLEEMVDQRLVYQSLKKLGKTADAKTVDAEIRTIGEQLKKRKQSWLEHLKQKGYTKTTFRRQIEWRLSWQGHLDATINDKLLEDYFVRHRSEYGGGQVRASHILLRADDPSNGEAIQKLVDRAAGIRENIQGSKLTFEAAAKKYSDGPSRLRGGDIGYFPRKGVQGETFSKAAFDLKKDQISAPVVTTFGVHLIKVTDIRAGKKKWTDVRAELRRNVARELFEKIADKQRSGAKVKYTDVVPYFDIRSAP